MLLENFLGAYFYIKINDNKKCELLNVEKLAFLRLYDSAKAISEKKITYLIVIDNFTYQLTILNFFCILSV